MSDIIKKKNVENNTQIKLDIVVEDLMFKSVETQIQIPNPNLLNAPQPYPLNPSPSTEAYYSDQILTVDTLVFIDASVLRSEISVSHNQDSDCEFFIVYNKKPDSSSIYVTLNAYQVTFQISVDSNPNSITTYVKNNYVSPVQFPTLAKPQVIMDPMLSRGTVTTVQEN